MKLEFIRDKDSDLWELYSDNHFDYVIKRFKVYKTYKYFVDEYERYFKGKFLDKKVRYIEYNNGSFYEVKENNDRVVPYFLMCYFKT